VSPDEGLQRALDAAGDNSVVCVTAGRYRLTSTLEPRWGSTLHFERGAILDGSRPIAQWTRSDGQWVATGQRQSFAASEGTRCGPNPAACEYEDVFFDGRPLVRVLDRGQLRSGRFYFDESADTIYLADDPTGHQVEATVTDTAIDAGGARNVTVRGATIEKFAKDGVITSEGWVVANNEIRYVHSTGLRAYGTTRVTGNTIHHTGNLGILGDDGTRLVFDGNELAHNNYLNFDLWHAGATKITGSVGTIVRNNWSHHNTGDGWWFDWDNSDTVVNNNRFEDNTRYGLFIEASFDTEIRNNDFINNGTSTKWGGAGVWITTSKNTEIHNNTFDGNRYSTLAFVSTDRGSSQRYGQRETTGLHVHDNTFSLDEGFVGVPFGDTDVYASDARNRFTNNDYAVPDRDGTWWQWTSPDGNDHTAHTWAQWNRAGQDTNGSLSTNS